MNKKLYVGNMSYDTTEDELRKLFAEVGPVVSVAVITDRMSGRSKGFAFVEMETNEAAQAAIERLNDYEVNRRRITVSEARPPRERSFGGGGGGGGGRGRDQGGKRGGPPRGGGGGGGRRY
ncbi:MAG TPA: RNA-binding protein [Anaerolineae bacterium]|nr:RNA-binding protein [Anaerolineae bacterium]